MKLRPIQIDPVNIGVEVLTSKRQRRELLVLPCAFGKSLVISHIVQKLPEDGNVLILQPSSELLTQNILKYEMYGNKASVYSASKGKKEFGRVIYATSKSVNEQFLKEADIEYVILDECFPYNTPIVTKDSVELIGELYKKFTKGIELPLVESYNEDSDNIEYKKITSIRNSGTKEMMDIKIVGGQTISVTDNHPFLTPCGWKKVKDLKKSDVLITTCGEDYTKSFQYLTDDQFDMVIGSSLGDGCIDKRCKTDTVRIKMLQGEKQKSYLEWKANILNCPYRVEKVENNGYAKTVAYRFTSRTLYFKDVYKTYERQIEELNYKSLAILWMDDGNLSKNQSTGSLYSLCSDENLVNKLKNKLVELGITECVVGRTKSSSSQKFLWYIRLRKSAVEKLSELCSKYIHPSMSYKIVDKYKSEVGTYEWDTNNLYSVAIVKEICKGGIEEVYNMEVEDNHTYSITSYSNYKATKYNIQNKKPHRGGIVVHNCDYSTKDGTKLNELLKGFSILGLTATPFYIETNGYGSFIRVQTRTKNALFNDIVHVVQMKTMTELGYWSEIRYESVEREFDREELKLNSTGAEFKEEVVVNQFEKKELFEEVKRIIETVPKEESIMVFLPSVDHFEDLIKKVPSASLVSSKTPKKERGSRIKCFLEGDLQTMCNSYLLGVGFDFPNLRVIVDALPTNSFRTHMQKILRGVRICPEKGKTHCKVYDLAGNSEKFGKDLSEYTIEWLPKYGWGLFKGERLMSDVAIQSQKVITKDDIIKNGGKVPTALDYKETQTVIPVGKYKGKKLSQVMFKDVRYLRWMWENKVGGEELGKVLTKLFY